MNLIVIVLIVCAGALAVVVLYNLSNINITERMRELATVKVLGFYDGESAAYIYRENFFSMTVGILFGLVGGVFLTRFVVSMAEVDVVMFARTIPLYAFVFAAGLTVLFTLTGTRNTWNTSSRVTRFGMPETLVQWKLRRSWRRSGRSARSMEI